MVAQFCNEVGAMSYITDSYDSLWVWYIGQRLDCYLR